VDAHQACGKTFFNLPGSMLYLGTTQWFGVPASV
jgi:simple sugar transport system permease protein